MITFAQLLAAVPEARQVRGADVPVTGVFTDSRQVPPGGVFVAIRGLQQDGHDFIADAVRRGAAAIVYEDPTRDRLIPERTASARVSSTRRAAALAAARFWGEPSHSLYLVGVTGTNGKTTTTYCVAQVLRACGFQTAVIGTLGLTVGGQTVELERTTPEATDLQRLLAQVRRQGVTHVSMEVSSHALDLERTAGIRFDAAVFTNLTQDHLDYHASLEEYLAAKLRLFTEYAESARPEKDLLGIVNADDAAAAEVLTRASCRTLTYGIKSDCDVRARDVEVGAAGATFRVETPRGQARIRLRLGGAFNVYNALAAVALAVGAELPLDAVVAGLEAMEPVPGRFERVDEGQNFTVIVDYAHSPDSLRNILESARALRPRRLWCVFGCGGDRDRGKRPVMGRVATELADQCVITSDNPRSEDPEAIIREIVAGVARNNYTIQPDRRRAIGEAVAACGPGDLLVIAGKGHEACQIIGDRTVPFDDREVAREALRARSAGAGAPEGDAS